jgi:hypothetical protein
VLNRCIGASFLLIDKRTYELEMQSLNAETLSRCGPFKVGMHGL